MTPCIRRRSPARGYALLTTLWAMTILFAFAAMMLQASYVNMRLTARRKTAAQALHLAITGMDLAGQKLTQSPTYTGFSAQSLGAGTVQVSVGAAASPNNRIVVISTGTVSSPYGTVTRQVRGTFDTGVISPVFYQAFAAKSDVTFSGTVVINSSPTAHQGNVVGNGNVSISGSGLSVDGYVHAGGTLTYGGSPSITGGTLSGASPVVFPDVDTTYQNQALANGSQTPPSGTLSVNSPTTTVQGKVVGNLSIGSSGAAINGVVWVTGNVTVGGPVTGTGAIVADGTLTLTAGYSVASTDMNDVAYITRSTSATAVTLTGNSSFKGLLYAPYGTIYISGSPTLVGGMMANSFNFSGTPTITRWTSFDQNAPPLPGPEHLRSWEAV